MSVIIAERSSMIGKPFIRKEKPFAGAANDRNSYLYASFVFNSRCVLLLRPQYGSACAIWRYNRKKQKNTENTGKTGTLNSLVDIIQDIGSKMPPIRSVE